jgi:hypothetical protein
MTNEIRHHAPCNTCGKLAQPYMLKAELNSLVTPTPEFLAVFEAKGGNLTMADLAELDARGALRRLCLGCFEDLIGRPITQEDLNTAPAVWINGWMRWTDAGRLASYDAQAAWDWAHPIIATGRQRFPELKRSGLQ